MARSPEGGFGDPDDRDATLELIIKVRPEPRPSLTIEPYVAIDNQQLWHLGYLLEDPQQTGQFATEKLARLIALNSVDWADILA